MIRASSFIVEPFESDSDKDDTRNGMRRWMVGGKVFGECRSKEGIELDWVRDGKAEE